MCILCLELAFSGAMILLLFMLVPQLSWLFMCFAFYCLLSSFSTEYGLAWIVNSTLPPHPSAVSHPLTITLTPLGQSMAVIRWFRQLSTKKTKRKSKTNSVSASNFPILLVSHLALHLHLHIHLQLLLLVIYSTWQRICFDKILIAVSLRFSSNVQHACQSQPRLNWASSFYTSTSYLFSSLLLFVASIALLFVGANINFTRKCGSLQVQHQLQL